MKNNKFKLTDESKELMLKYNDRKMLKWQPFAALRGHAASVNETANSRLKTTMPTLSEEQMDNISKELVKIENVQNSFKKGEFDINKLDKKLFKIFYNDFIDVTITRNYKIDVEKQLITVDNMRLSYEHIVEII